MAGMSTGYVSGTYGKVIDQNDAKITAFITDHTGTYNSTTGAFVKDPTGTLILSASESLSLQQLMADQSIAAQTATQTLKSIKDSISAAARNI